MAKSRPERPELPKTPPSSVIRRLSLVTPVTFGGKRMGAWPSPAHNEPGLVRECEGGYEILTFSRKNLIRLFVPRSAALAEYDLGQAMRRTDFRDLVEKTMGAPRGRRKGDPPRQEHRAEPPPAQAQEAAQL